jgi:hypothetical protein
MKPKKKSRRCRGLGLDSGLDLAISRFIHSLDLDTDLKVPLLPLGPSCPLQVIPLGDRGRMWQPSAD